MTTPRNPAAGGVVPAGAFPARGVIEGFYGTPWTREQRLEFVDFIGARGMSHFVYGPKEDPHLRREWRLPFAAEERAHLGELRAACDRWGMRLMVCVSPGLTISYADPADVQALTAKFDDAVAAGAHDIGLLLDDIPGRLQHPADIARFTSLAEAHAHLVREVLAGSAAGLGDTVGVAVCPTVYCGYGTEDYLVDLAAAIPAYVDLFWTGRAICSATLDLADAGVFADATGRPPLYWDNYPVNDVAMIWEAHLGPYRGRDPRLASASRGVIANPMDRYESSKIPLATIADFLRDPEGYEPEESWRRAIRDVVTGRTPREPLDAREAQAVAAFTAYADNVRYSCLEPSDAPTLSRLLEDVAFASAVGDAEQVAGAGRAVAAYGARLADAVAHIQSPAFPNPALAAEQAPWLAKSALGAQALLALGDAVAASAADPAPAVLIAGAVAPHLNRLREDRYRVFGDVLDMTLADYVEGQITKDHPVTTEKGTR